MTAVWPRARPTVHARQRPAICFLVWSFLTCVASLSRPESGHAQGDRFGSQARADAASQAIVLAVQQGISALPPTSAQSVVYEFRREPDVPVRSERLGPISLRAPETVGRGDFILRASSSYFALPATLGPIDYRLEFDDPTVSPTVFAKLGTNIDAKVGVFGLTLSYGITTRVEANLSLPIVLVDAQASQTYSARAADPTRLGFRRSIPALDEAIANQQVVLQTVPFSPQFSFNDGTHVGVGRISLGSKALVYFADPFELAAACEFYFPSPSEQQFAGSDSAAILPRLIGAARLTDWMRALVDVGYDYDFDVDQLRRFVWDVGLSFPLAAGTFDVGLGGSSYAAPIEWTPSQFREAVVSGDPPEITATAVGDNQTGTNYVDFLFGAKVRLSDAVILGGAVNVPVTNEGLQPIVAGTLVLEFYF